jgi:hypothetical protein
MWAGDGEGGRSGAHRYGTAIDIVGIEKDGVGTANLSGGTIVDDVTYLFIVDLNDTAATMGVEFGIGQFYRWTNLPGTAFTQWNGRYWGDATDHLHLEVCRVIANGCQ